MAQLTEVHRERALDALGNGTRRAIVGILASGALPVGRIAALLPISRPAVSKHLMQLEEAELVAHVKRGNRNVYRLRRAGFEAARGWLESFWDDALTTFAQVAESEESP